MNVNGSKSYQAIAHLIMVILSALSILPVILMLISSFTDENILVRNGYTFFPSKLSLEAYKYLWQQFSYILNAYMITILITAVGTAASLIITSMLAYPLSRTGLPFRKTLTYIVFFTILFNGGLVPTYLIYTEWFGIKNTLWGLLIPSLLMNGFNVLLMRTFFITNIPVAIIESANIDGAGELRIFLKVILPLSMPILATVGLFVAVAYWNDWINGLIYITNPYLFNIQNVLNRLLTDIQFMNSQVASKASLNRIPGTSVKMAIAMVALLPIVITYPFFQKYFVKGITIGAVKG
jgi:ABC-type sugar transport system, permease component